MRHMNTEFYIAATIFLIILSYFRFRFNRKQITNEKRRFTGALIGAVIAISYCIYFLTLKGREFDLYLVIGGSLSIVFTMLLGVIGVSQINIDSDISSEQTKE